MTMIQAKATKRTRGKGRSVLDRIEEGADRILLDIVKNGQAVADVNGRLIRQHPSAAMLAVIRARLKDTRHQRQSRPALSLIEEAERRGLAVDPVAGKIGPGGS